MGALVKSLRRAFRPAVTIYNGPDGRIVRTSSGMYRVFDETGHYVCDRALVSTAYDELHASFIESDGRHGSVVGDDIGRRPLPSDGHL